MAEIFTRNRIIGLVLAALVFVVDQVIKWWMVGPLDLRMVGKIDVLSFFDLTYAENRGVSLGMLEASSIEMRYLLVALTGFIAVIVLVWMMRERILSDILGLGLILGGALGNIYDRYSIGYVIDYADLHVSWIPSQICLSYSEGLCRPFLIFNFADAAITIGVVIILVRSLFVREKDTEEAGADSVPSEN